MGQALSQRFAKWRPLPQPLERASEREGADLPPILRAPHRRWIAYGLRAGAACLTLRLATPPRASDPQPYNVTFVKTGDTSLDKLAQAPSDLVSLRLKA